MQRSLVVASLFFTVALAAAEYERRLIPVVAATPGAFNTQWFTRVENVQELEVGVEIVGGVGFDIPPGIGRSQPHALHPPTSQSEPPGSILYVPKAVAERVHISARLWLRQGSEFGDETVLPVARESEFVPRTLYFLQIKNRLDERAHLRVYSMDLDHPDAAVRVRIQAAWVGKVGGWEFVYDRLHRLEARQKYVEAVSNDDVLPIRPLALQLALDPFLDTLPEEAEIAISVVPAAENLRIWGMFSETNNVTQRVRISVPD